VAYVASENSDYLILGGVYTKAKQPVVCAAVEGIQGVGDCINFLNYLAIMIL
jgi:hypothetical protein